MRENGRSSRCSKRGKIKPRPMPTTAASATQRMASCGRCSNDSKAEPISVTRLKLSTRPTITRKCRETSCFGLTATATAPSAVLCVPDVPDVPEKKITGSTGRMHGEMPVISPPTRPISARDNIFTIRYHIPRGLLAGRGQYGVDHVHRRVGGVYASAYQPRIVDFETVPLAGHLHLSTLQRLVGAVNSVRAFLPCRAVIGQDALQHL